MGNAHNSADYAAARSRHRHTRVGETVVAVMKLETRREDVKICV